MAQRLLSNLGLTFDWSQGSDGWKAGMDVNLLVLDTLVQGRAISMLGDPPFQGQTVGDCYIITPTASGAWSIHGGEIAIWTDIQNTWVFVVPQEGWKLYVTETEQDYIYSDFEWVQYFVGSTRSVRYYELDDRTLLATDENNIVLSNNDSAHQFVIPDAAEIDFEVGGSVEICQMGAGQITFTPDEGLRSLTGAKKSAGRYASCRLMRVGYHEWLLTGDLTGGSGSGGGGGDPDPEPGELPASVDYLLQGRKIRNPQGNVAVALVGVYDDYPNQQRVVYYPNGPLSATTVEKIANDERAFACFLDEHFEYVSFTNGAGDSRVVKYDLTPQNASGIEQVATFIGDLAADCQAMAYDGVNVWVQGAYTHKIYKLNKLTLARETTYPTPEVASQTMVWDNGFLWIGSKYNSASNGEIVKFNTATGQIDARFFCVRFPFTVLKIGSILFVHGAGGFATYTEAGTELYGFTEINGSLSDYESSAGGYNSIADDGNYVAIRRRVANGNGYDFFLRLIDRATGLYVRDEPLGSYSATNYDGFGLVRGSFGGRFYLDYRAPGQEASFIQTQTAVLKAIAVGPGDGGDGGDPVTPGTEDANQALMPFAYASGNYVAHRRRITPPLNGESFHAWTSPDGLSNWVRRTGKIGVAPIRGTFNSYNSYNVYAVIGPGGRICTTSNLDVDWAVQQITTFPDRGVSGATFTDITVDAYRIFVAGTNGILLASVDGTDFTEKGTDTIPGTMDISSLTIDGGAFAILGTIDGLQRVMTSTQGDDAELWTARTFPAVSGFVARKIKITGGSLFLVGYKIVSGNSVPAVFTSSDNGDSWTDLSFAPVHPSQDVVNDIIYSPSTGAFVALCDNVHAYSFDLIDWVTEDIGQDHKRAQTGQVVSAQGVTLVSEFVQVQEGNLTVGKYRLLRTKSGVKFAVVPVSGNGSTLPPPDPELSNANQELRPFAWTGSKFVAYRRRVTKQGNQSVSRYYAWTSDNGVSAWTPQAGEIGYAPFAGAYSNGVYVLSAPGGRVITTSDLSAPWSTQQITSFPRRNISGGVSLSVTTDGNRFFLLGSSGIFMASTDGISFTEKGTDTIPASLSILSMAFGGSYFAILGEAANTQSVFVTSSAGDLETWTQESFTSDIGVFRAAGIKVAGNKLFLYGRKIVNGKALPGVYVSSNQGETFTDISFAADTSATSDQYLQAVVNDILFFSGAEEGEGTWVALCQNMHAYTTDLVTWTTANTQLKNRLFGVQNAERAVVAEYAPANSQLALYRLLSTFDGTSFDVVPASGPGDEL